MSDWMIRKVCGCLKIWLPQGVAFLPCKEHEHMVAGWWDGLR